jgi:prepilin-type processing-associated H-X9-DG protein
MAKRERPPDFDAYNRALYGSPTKAELDAVRRDLAKHSESFARDLKDFEPAADVEPEEADEVEPGTEREGPALQRVSAVCRSILESVAEAPGRFIEWGFGGLARRCAEAIGWTTRINRFDYASPEYEAPEHRPGRRFTLVDALGWGGLTLIAFLLIVPSLVAQREAARRKQCVENLKMLGLALSNYQAALNTFPLAGYPFFDRACGRWTTGSGFLPMAIPYVEGNLNLYASINFNLPPARVENSTVMGMAPALLWCPSDTGSGMTIAIADPASALGVCTGADSVVKVGSPWHISRSSYVGCPGVTPEDTGIPPDDPRFARGVASRTGIFPFGRSIGVADVEDGTSNTIAVGERNLGSIIWGKSNVTAGGWTLSAYSDTIFSSLYPINLKGLGDGAGSYQTPGGRNATDSAASSAHPGGANFCMADGSVRFIKDTVDSWAISPSTGLPPGVVRTDYGYMITEEAKLGVYQALSTRAHFYAEPITSGEY